MSVTAPLAPLRARAGTRLTEGLDEATLARLASGHPDLGRAIAAAAAQFAALEDSFDALLDLDEAEQVARVQEGYVNFYADDAVNPYVALAACGPWGGHAEGRGALRRRRLRHDRLRPHARCGAGGHGPAAGDGQHHDA